MDSLFKKATIITDLHHGKKSNDNTANQDISNFLDWYIDESLTWGADTCIMMGDWNDHRHSIQVNTLDYSFRNLEKLNKAFKKVYVLPGNHDLFYKNSTETTSLVFSKKFENIELLSHPTLKGNVSFLPWLVNDDHKKVKNIKSRYTFGHLECSGFLMNAKVEMPDHGGLNEKSFINQEFTFSGHFHIRQAKGNIIYTGNVFPFNFSDNWDEDRGMTFLEWGKDPFFKAWPDQPLYRTMLLSELINNPDKYLCQNLTARVSLDIDISYEEAQFIRDTYIKDYSMRKMDLVPCHKNAADDQEFTEDVPFESIDQIVINGLNSVQAIGLEQKMLVDIYKSL